MRRRPESVTGTARSLRARATRGVLTAALLWSALTGRPAAVSAQVSALDTVATGDLITRALDHEDARRLTHAVAAYRELLTRALRDANTDGDQLGMAVLGLERVWFDLGQRDSLLPLLNDVLARRPSDPIARSVQFRTLGAGADASALYDAYVGWRRAAPRDAAPFREYAKALIATGRATAADSVLRDAAEALGGPRELYGEIAQLNVALERWSAAASAWRGAMAEAPWLEQAAVFSLQRVPPLLRDSVRRALNAPPVELVPRRVLANLELGWGDPRRAWGALAAVRSNDSAYISWRDFAEQAEFAGAAAVSRDVWSAVFTRTRDARDAERAARQALAANDPSGALAFAESARIGRTPADLAETVLPIEIAALGELGRPHEAARRAAEAAPYLTDDGARADLARPLITAWLRAGEVDNAREAAREADALDDDAIAGWLALYSGDLTEARRRLVRMTSRDGPLVDALAVLSRTRVDAHAGVGRAFLALAQRDTAAAAEQFALLADSLPDAAPVLLAVGARLEGTRGAASRGERLWLRIASDHATAPEAPEALLELARLLRKRGDTAGAVVHFETLLIDHPGSAFVPQARRELERLRGQVPGADA